MIHEGLNEALLVEFGKEGRVILGCKALAFGSRKNFRDDGIVRRNHLEGAEVFDALGGSLGHVAELEGGVLEVDCLAVRGARLQIPLEWVEEIGESVRLCKTSRQVMEETRRGAARRGPDDRLGRRAVNNPARIISFYETQSMNSANVRENMQVFASGGRTMVSARLVHLREALRFAATGSPRLVGTGAKALAAAWPPAEPATCWAASSPP